MAPVASNVAWQWPTQGNVIQGFSNSDGGNKGIDISGSRGQAVKAAASGLIKKKKIPDDKTKYQAL